MKNLNIKNIKKSIDFSWVSKFVKENAHQETITESVSTDRSPKDFDISLDNQNEEHNLKFAPPQLESVVPLSTINNLTVKKSKFKGPLLASPVRNLNSIRAIHDKRSGSNPRSSITSPFKEKGQARTNITEVSQNSMRPHLTIQRDKNFCAPEISKSIRKPHDQIKILSPRESARVFSMERRIQMQRFRSPVVSHNNRMQSLVPIASTIKPNSNAMTKLRERYRNTKYAQSHKFSSNEY